jgi:U3 small nucleolar RNA-associated protein 23
MVEDALTIPEAEKDTLPASKPTETPFVVKPHRKAKGPNPLSVKKKQQKVQSYVPQARALLAEPSTNSHTGDGSQKRKRDEGETVDNDNDNTAPSKKKRRRRKPDEVAAAAAVTSGSS